MVKGQSTSNLSSAIALNYLSLLRQKFCCSAVKTLDLLVLNIVSYLISTEKQVLIIYTNLSQFCFLGTTQVLAPNVWANKNPRGKSNSRPTDCEADALPHDYQHYRIHWYCV